MNILGTNVVGTIATANLVLALALTQSAQAAVLNLNFNSGLSNSSGGDLVFQGTDGFEVTFTDDNSSGSIGGNANGVHITNINAGNIKVGHSTDFVLGAFNSFIGNRNYHSSGIVALFNQGVESVSFLDTDDDRTTKSLFAFDQFGDLIYQSVPGTQQIFAVDTSMTLGNALIHSVEFDTLPGTTGGSFDGTFFTIDDFQVEYTSSVPEPHGILGILSLVVILGRKVRELN